jgi:hypothetical protein
MPLVNGNRVNVSDFLAVMLQIEAFMMIVWNVQLGVEATFSLVNY